MRVWLRLMSALLVTVLGCIHTSIRVRFRPDAGHLAYRLMRQGVAGRLFCRIFNIHVTPSASAEVVSPGTLLVSNHLTVMDPIFLASQLDACFAGKAEIGRWPLIGWICKCYAMLLVDRRRRGQARTFAFQVRERLEQHASVLVFPEGTTGNGTELLPFKTGAFESIKDWDQAKLQPVFIHVTALDGQAVQGAEGRTAIAESPDPRHSTFVGHILYLANFRRLDIEVRIGPLLDVAGMDRREIANAAREAILMLSRNNVPATG